MTVAHAISLALASGDDRQRAVDELELTETAAVSREKRSQATWDMLFFIGGGKGV